MARGLPDLTLNGAVPAAAARSPRWADLRVRIASAAVLVPVGLFCLWFAPVTWAVLLGIAAVGMALEWAALCGLGSRPLPGGALALAMVGVAVAAASGLVGAAFLFIGPFGALIWLVTQHEARRWPLVGGAVYIGVPLVCLIWLRGQPTVGAADVLFVLLVIWCGDIGAYVAGRWLGGPKLAPAISPGKTWSGAAGGLVASMLAGAATSAVFGGGSVTHLLFWVMPVAGVIGVAGQIGDLFESGVKRWAGVKDSGRSIPGHGGLLDRLDAVLTAGPVAALLAWWAGQGMSQGVYLWH